MKPEVFANIILAAVVTLAGMQFTRSVDAVDKLVSRVSEIEVRVAVLEAKQP